jgi:dTDP-glucose pyrophosphorylase
MVAHAAHAGERDAREVSHVGQARPAVVLAAGRGTRMQAGGRADGVPLTQDQEHAAAHGAKAMMPINGRPFLDYVLRGLADAGVEEVCIVVAASDASVRGYYGKNQPPRGISLRYVVQTQPLGTADATSSARECVGGRPFILLNGDNYYPVEAIRALLRANGCGLVAFHADSLVDAGYFPAERLGSFALIETDGLGKLAGIVEKPGAEAVSRAGPHALISMNLWSFTPHIFSACERVQPSPRGERELVDAVRLALREGVPFDVVSFAGPVLDLTNRADIPRVSERLRSIEVSG